MASKTQPLPLSSTKSCAPKLPIISSGQSLISPAQSPRQPSPHEQACHWAKSIRLRLQEKIALKEKIKDQDISLLTEELVNLMITALHKDDRTSWQILREALLLTKPLQHLFKGKQEIYHYIQRVYHHVDLHKERLFDLQITGTLKQVFSEEISHILSTKAKRDYCPPTPPPLVRPPLKRPVPKFQLPDGRNPYLLQSEDGQMESLPKLLTLADLRVSIPDVVLEMATREAIWKACPAVTNNMLGTDLPDCLEEDEDEESQTARISCADTTRSVAESPRIVSHGSKENEPKVPIMTGREAVQYFAKCYHTGKIEALHFNQAPSRHYQPYNLISVAKDKVNPEHFVFSTFGVLHVQGTSPSENQSLSAWHREAVLHTAASSIPFFKNYLVGKMFRQWRSNLKFSSFAKFRANTCDQLLTAVPIYGAGLRETMRLCQDVLHLQFLPLNTRKTYKLLEFENNVHYMSLQAKEMLERFFRYNRVISETTQQEVFKQVQHCEEQARHKNFYNTDSLQLQKKKKKQRQESLRRAKQETSRLGNFVKLMDQLLLAHLVMLARHNVITFVNNVMVCPLEDLQIEVKDEKEEDEDKQRDGLFAANLVFNKNDVLAISPAKEKFDIVLQEVFSSIPQLLCKESLPLSGSLPIKDDTDDDQNKQPVHNRKPPVKADVTTKVSELGSSDGFSKAHLVQSSLSSTKSSTRHASLISMVKDPKKTHYKLPSTVASMSQQSSSYSLSLVSSSSFDAVCDDGDVSLQSDVILTPNLPHIATPTKSEDDLGQATPDLVVEHREGILSGRGFVGHYVPLSCGNLQDKLDQDYDYQTAVKLQKELLLSAMEEVDEFCGKNAWLNEIYQFCKTWEDHSAEEWKGVAAFTIEQKLNEIRQWVERVRNFDRTYTTDNGIIRLDCAGVSDILVPKLNTAFRQLCAFVAGEAENIATKFCSEMTVILERMKDKETNIRGFALYARTVQQCKKQTPFYQQRVDYLRSLLEVVRMSWRQLNPHEEHLEEQVLGCWEAFLSQIQDAVEFVNTQTPLITQNLEDTHQKLEQEARTLCEHVTSGRFLDPSQKPTTILEDISKYCEQFYNVQHQLQEASQWKEAITGVPYDLTFLQEMSAMIDSRQELWKYVEVSTHAILEWKATLFKKLNISKVLEKLTEWEAASEQMKDHLPEGDRVLDHWNKQLIEFKQELPLLNKLCSDALKERHWKSIFVGMGEQYDADYEFTIAELLSYNLMAHSDLITSVYAAAIAEYTIERRLMAVKHLWADQKFKLAKYIPQSVLDSAAEVPVVTRGRSADSRKRSERVLPDKLSASSTSQGFDKKYEQLYIMVDVEEMQYLLEDSIVGIQVMLTSPYLGEHRRDAEQWAKSLAHIQEIVNLWHSCQKKWLFLMKLFENTSTQARLQHLAEQFQPIHLKFAEFMQAVVTDPKVSSILTQRRGDKAFRIHQGERLCSLILSLIQQQEEIIKQLGNEFTQARDQFPRLYFLSNEELVDLLGITRNPNQLRPFVRKCFSGIDDVTFALPNDDTPTNTLDYALHVDKLEVSCLQGVLGEQLMLDVCVPPALQSTTWLVALEHHMKTSMLHAMETCLQTRLEDGSRQPMQLLDELAKYDKYAVSAEADNAMKQAIHAFSHWLLRFPAQCVVTAEAVLWERRVHRALDRQDQQELKNQRNNLVSRLEQYSQLLTKNNSVATANDKTRRRLHSLLASLISQGLHHKEVINGLLSGSDISENCYDWLKVLKYHMEIRTILRAKTESMESEIDSTQAPRQTSFDEIDPNRNLTTISTGYQFGSCSLSQMGSSFAYDMEYLGPQRRLVFTPLTERAYLNLTLALKSFTCGTLMGPSGTGKSETVKDLSKAMGRHLVVVTCTSLLKLPIMNQYMNGLVQSGCWGLFDNMDLLTTDLLSVVAQQLDYLSNALRVLDSSGDNQYRIRGQPRFDKKTAITKSAENKIRRNSLTTLHSLPVDEGHLLRGDLGIERQSTVPHGFNDKNLRTYFAEPYEGERRRRHSIEREIKIKESELYKAMRPPPLFYEHVTLHRKPKQDFKQLSPHCAPYKSSYLGNILFNGRLVKASSNYGCFLTLNTNNPSTAKIPDNMRVVLRPCAMVVPDTKIIIEVILYSNGFQQASQLASKLHIFFDLLKTQMPRKEEYSFGLSLLCTVLQTACTLLQQSQREHEQLLTSEANKPVKSEDVKSNTSSPVPSLLDLPTLSNHEENAVITAASSLMTNIPSCKADMETFRGVLRDVFPSSARVTSGFGKQPSPILPTDIVRNSLKELLEQHYLVPNPDFIDKIVDLYSALETQSAVLLLGPAGCGKTTIYSMLAKALTLLHSRTHDSIHADEELLPDKLLSSRSSKSQKSASARHEMPATDRSQSTLPQQSSLTNFPQVDYELIYPNAHEPKQLLGYFTEDGWHDGLLTKLLRTAHEQAQSAQMFLNSFNAKRSKLPIQPPGVIRKWLVLDGSLNPEWIDGMNSLLDDKQYVTLPNREQMLLKDATKIIFEVADLQGASPATITRCSVVNCGNKSLPWKALIESWAHEARQKWVINSASLQVIANLANSTFPATLSFLKENCTTAFSHNVRQTTNQDAPTGLQEVTDFLRFLSAMLDRHFLREDFERRLNSSKQSKESISTSTSVSTTGNAAPHTLTSGSSHRSGRLSSMARIEDLVPNYLAIIKALFGFSYIWGFGGNLHDSCLSKFDVFARTTLSRAAQPLFVPDTGTVFDYTIDIKKGGLTLWSSRPTERLRSLPPSYTLVPEIEKYALLADMMLSRRQSVLIAGEPGVGKSSIVEHVISSKRQLTKVAVCSTLTPAELQKIILRNVASEKSTRTIGPSRTKTPHLFYLQDLNMSYKDKETGCNAVLELWRQLVSTQSVYDMHRQVLSPVSQADFIATATNPGSPGSGLGYSCHTLDARVARHLVILNMASPSESLLHSIYGRTIHSWLEEFPTYSVQHHQEFARALVQGVLDVYKGVREHLHPSPATPHYVFNLKHVTRALDGILLMSSRTKARPKPRAQRDNAEAQETKGSSTIAAESLSLSAVEASADASKDNNPAPMMRTIARLWCSECTCVFGDGIIAEEDQQWFETLLETTVRVNFCTGTENQIKDIDEVKNTEDDKDGDTHVNRVLTPVRGYRSSPLTPDNASSTASSRLMTPCSTSPYNSEGLPADSLSQPATPIDQLCITPTSTTAGASHGGELPDLCSVLDNGTPTSMTSHTEEKIEETRGETEVSTDAVQREHTVSTDSTRLPTADTRRPSNTLEMTSGAHTAGSTESKSSGLRSTSASSAYTSASDAESMAPSNSTSRTATARTAGTVTNKAKSPSTLYSQNTTSQSQSGQNKAVKRSRGVTFKAGLIADCEIESYAGPLLQMDQVRDQGEMLSHILLSKYIIPLHAEVYGASHDKAYLECTHQNLAEALYTCLALYNRHTSQRTELVFFNEAIHHAARLSRVLACQGGHALLLGQGYCTGRATLIRLASFIANCTLFEPHHELPVSDGRHALRQHMQQASQVAALQGRQVVLLVRHSLGKLALQDLAVFMKEGNCPGLYTEEEMQNVASQMTPGQVKITSAEKIDSTFKKFIQRVRQNMHVVICLDVDHGLRGSTDHSSLHTWLCEIPGLLHNTCHLDVYRPWNHEALVTVAEFLLRDPATQNAIPWNEHKRSEQISMVASAMSYVHTSSQSAIHKLYSHERMQYRFFTPLTFMEFIHIFKVIGNRIAKEEKTKYHRYNTSLTKVTDAFETITEYKREVSDLVPRHQKALDMVKEHVGFVEAQRGQYIQALDVCKEQERTIEDLLGPLEKLRNQAQTEFNKVNPTYHAALRALKALDPKATEEIKSYRVPPDGVTMVMNTICLLFRVPQTWEQSKQMLMKDNFFHELEFYDKDHIPEDIYEELGHYYYSPRFQMASIAAVSLAAAGLCSWVRAVYQYAEICRTMKPRIQELMRAEHELNKAQATLGSKRVEANRIKSSLEKEIHAHKEAVKESKSIEKRIGNIERKITKANNLMNNMNVQHTLWKSESKSAKGKLKTLPGDALLTAACVCYHGPLDSRTRSELLTDWMNRCELSNFDPGLRMGREVKRISLSAKLDRLMLRPSYSITDSMHSIQHTDNFNTEVISHKGDDVSSLHETERASTASSMPAFTTYRHHPSIYDTGITFRTEIRMLEMTEIPNTDSESIDASSVSSRNLLAIRESYSLQEILSTFSELSEWKLQGLPTDVYSVHNALVMRVCASSRRHCWPLLVDPDNQAQVWVTALQKYQATPDEEEEEMFPKEYATTDVAANKLIEESDLMDGSEVIDGSEMADGSEASRVQTASTAFSAAGTLSLASHRVPLAQSARRPTVTHDKAAVSSLATSGTSLAGLVQGSIERPDLDLWIVAADAQDLSYKIVNAIVHGLTILVTHLERRPLDSLFRGLLSKHYTVTRSGHKTVCVGDADLLCHPSFKMYLSTSTSLFLQGAGIHHLPVQQLSVVNLCISQEGVIESLLHRILQIERTEFEGQKRSIEADMLHHKKELNIQQEHVLQKTLELAGALLEDRAMLDILINCQKNVQHNKMILEETQYLQEHLLEKQSPYVPVAMHGAKLYEMVQRVAVLNPLYHMQLSQFLDIFTSTVKGRHRGKGSTGAPQARAQELIDATTGSIYTFVSLMMFEQHTHLFAVLVTLEHMRMSQKLTNQELGLFVNGVDTSKIEDTIVFEDKPTWISNKVWLDCAALETTMFAFRGLRESISRHSAQWQEYFKNTVELKGPLPGTKLQVLSPFQKCLLWRICCPNKMYEVSSAIVLYQLGGVVSPPASYDIHSVYEYSDTHIPVTFILPADIHAQPHHNSIKAQSFASPMQEVLQLAKERGIEGRVHIVTCGGEPKHKTDLENSLKDCMTAGYWLIVQNAHLIHAWTDNVLHLIKMIINYSEEEESDNKENCPESSEVSQRQQSDLSAASVKIHKDFRLWITTRSDIGNTVPGVLIQKGLKVTCELTSDFRSTLKRNYSIIEKLFSRRDPSTLAVKQMYGKYNSLVPVALLFSLLRHRSTYNTAAFARPAHWTQADLTTVWDQLRIMMLLCQKHNGSPEACGQVLAGHCVDVEDARVVQALTDGLLLPPDVLNKLRHQESIDESQGTSALLQHLLPPSGQSFFHHLDTQVELTPELLGLPIAAESDLTNARSRSLLADLVHVCGAPDLMCIPADVSLRKADIVLQELSTLINTLPSLPKTEHDASNPLQCFLHSEVQLMQHIVQIVRRDLTLLIRVTQGKAPPSFITDIMLHDLSKQRVPVAWLHQTFPSGGTVVQWGSELIKRAQLLNQYFAAETSGVITYNLAAFLRPDRFLQNVLQTYVRKEFKDLHTCELDVQFLRADAKITTSPSVGVYLDGLMVHNATWDNTCNSLAAATIDSATPTPLPTLWLKPMDRLALQKIRCKNAHFLHPCPLYLGSHSKLLAQKNIISVLELPSQSDIKIWAEKKVFLSCVLPKIV